MNIGSFNSIEEATKELQKAKERLRMLEERFKNAATSNSINDEEVRKVQQEYINAEESFNYIKNLVDEYKKYNRTNNPKVNKGINELMDDVETPNAQRGIPNDNSRGAQRGTPNDNSSDSQPENTTIVQPVDYPVNKKGVVETIIDMMTEIFGKKSSGVSNSNNNKIGLVSKIAQIFGFKPDSNEFKLLSISVGVCFFSIICYIFKPIFDVVVGTVKMIAGGLLNSISLGVGFMEVFGPYIIGAVFFALFVMGAIKVYQYANIFMELLDDKLNKKIDEIKYGSRRRGKSSNTKNRDTKSNNEKSSNMTKQASSTRRRMIYDDEDIYISTESNKKEVEEIIEISKDNMQEEIIEISEENIQEEIIKEDMIEISESDIQKEVIEENVTKVSEDDIQEETTEESIIEISEDDTHEEVIKETN